MKLKKLRINNFRGYEDESISFEQLTGLVGKNDVGKSTILEALDIFFNAESKSGTILPDVNDLRVGCKETKEFSISCFFEVGSNEHVVIDTKNGTNLKKEYLLNKDGLLEIVKTWNCSNNSLTAKSLSINLNAEIPYINDKQFITMKIAELRKELDLIKSQIDDYEKVNKSLKADIRQRLYKFYSESVEKREELISIKSFETDDTDLWKAINKNLPLYFLFQSDRTNSDSDSEVQNPLKVAARKAIMEKEKELKEIEAYVIDEVSKIGDETVEKLSEFDSTIATGLLTKHKTRAWESLFSFDIMDDKEIPLNKRGSGVRRLILLSYFRAEAERAKKGKEEKSIIYAIEEPETAQHPDFQLMILESFQKMCENADYQVIFTTHTPEIAKLLEPESLIFIKMDNRGLPKVIEDEQDKIEGVINSLGILPSITSKFVVCVEGEHDVNFLRNVNNSISKFKEIIDLSDISIIPMSGSKLSQWINRNYLENSNVKEFHIYDSDVESYCKIVEEMNMLNDGRRKGINTDLSEMENYIPISLIQDHFNIEMSLEKNWLEEDIPKYLVDKVMLQILDSKKRENSIKGILNGSLTKKITEDMLYNHNVYNEVESWFIQMAEWKKQ